MQEKKTITAYKKGLREVILKTAMKAFAEKGIRAVKMDDIAEMLTISKRTMYELYATKEELLYEGVKTYYDRQKIKLLELNKCKDLMEILVKYYRMRVEESRSTSPAFYNDLIKYPRVLRYLNREKKYSRENLLKFFERGVYEGYFRDDINFELTARLFDALGRYVMEKGLYGQYSIEELFSSLSFVTLRGLCTEKGIKKLEQLL
jgi:AcrR family transcriptional regulator